MKQSKRKIFTKLYKEHSSYMYGICLRYTKDTDDAQDVLQDGFIKVYNALDSFKGESKIKTWISRIMVNTAINHYRKKKVLNTYPIEENEVGGLNFDKIDVLNKMSADELLELIKLLPEGYSLVFNLYVIDELKHKEIAKELNISVGTSKSQLMRGRKKFEELLYEKALIKLRK